MSSFYKSIGLYDRFNIDIEMHKPDFIESLKKITYKTNTTFISLVPDNGIPTRFEYRGEIKEDYFLIKRRLYFFDTNVIVPVIKGRFSQQESKKTLINIELFPSKIHMISLTFLSILLLIIILNINYLLQENAELMFSSFIPLILVISHYFTLKACIKRGRYDFEREIHFLAQNNNQFKL
ncbi:hypothetical protein ACM46_05755 [Chryseobacterium angstadtii]|uniref:Uncharacterized protein n=1 Tax=Chryseobacterium angstadtii TaxID=558151 RepID=A0A0J7IG45_9FLAO|nr:hypothetical protein [Chryseobacterium angstadtii]KMQ65403.1 hypothetical protein ACM46_05755 [Chryseobacterium angstadtii]